MARALDGSEAFVKTRPDAGEGEYALEAAGLRWLAEPGALRVPAVIEVAEDYLALEWVEPGSLSAAGAEELGRGLAVIHAAGAPCFGDPGFGEQLGVEARDRLVAAAPTSRARIGRRSMRASSAAARADRTRARRACRRGRCGGRARV